ncbi:hypothetical protein BaRGS_00035582, partial [Batillaria attramentaria]
IQSHNCGMPCLVTDNDYKCEDFQVTPLIFNGELIDRMTSIKSHVITIAIPTSPASATGRNVGGLQDAKPFFGVTQISVRHPLCLPAFVRVPELTFEPAPCNFVTMATGDPVTVKCCVTPVSDGSELVLSRRKVFPGEPEVLTSVAVGESSCCEFCVSEEIDAADEQQWGEYYCNLVSPFMLQKSSFVFVNSPA